MTRDYHNSWQEKTKNLFRQAVYPCVGAAAILIIIIVTRRCLSLTPDYFIQQYKQLFRVPLFSGFLTIGSFMLSFKAFTILRLHDDVYKSDDYMARWLKKAEVFSLDPWTYLDPLSRLTDTFFLAILFSLLTAFLQLTLGLVPKLCSVYTCIWSALFSGLLVVRALYILRLNLVEWQKLLSQKYATQLEKALTARKVEKEKRDSGFLSSGANPEAGDIPMDDND